MSTRFDLIPGSVPRCKRPYRLPPDREAALEALLKEVLELGWIQPLDRGSAWASPAFPVPKKGAGKWRLVVDYRLLNEATVADVYPLPLIDQILESQGRCKVFSLLDLKHGFFQVPLAEADRHKTAFVTPKGLYQWRVMPMGLRNAPSRFQRIMAYVLRNGPAANAYMDDILVGSEGETVEDALRAHAKHLRQLLQALQENNFFVEFSIQKKKSTN